MGNAGHVTCTFLHLLGTKNKVMTRITAKSSIQVVVLILVAFKVIRFLTSLNLRS